jgi:ferredoxin
MRICPTGVIQPALTESGIEGLWTPVMDFRLSRGGCLKDCVACGHLCPSAAIRPLSLDERLGADDFASRGPVRIGTAFFDRSRCLPWAMDRPCIVCQEMCPVSPKAIFTRTEYQVIRGGLGTVIKYDQPLLKLSGVELTPGALSGGDYFLSLMGAVGYLGIADNGPDWLQLPEAATGAQLASGSRVGIVVRLQRPQVDPAKCIGCGACEHACPVGAIPAIRVSPENASRGGAGVLLAGSK